MKKILLLLLIITNVFLWGQGGQAEYKIELYGLNYSVNAGVKNSTSSHVTITVIYNDNSTEDLYFRPIANNGDNENNWTLSPPQTSSKLPVTAHTEGFVNFRTGTDANYDQYDAINICNENNYNVDTHSPRMTWISYKMKVTPIHTLVSLTDAGATNTVLPSEDKINLYARQGFAANLYNYQYSLDNVNWINISPSLSNLNKLSVSAKDLFGNNYSQYIGQNIYFRVASCLSNGTYQSVSSPVVLTMIKSAPHILSSTVTPTKCFDSTDGTVTLNFDRTLITGETLKISLVNTVTGAAVLNQDITGDLQSATSFTLQNLPPGNYKLDLLGTYNGNATYTDSPSHTINFEITKPTPVTFSMTSQTNVYCFQGSDGVINLTAAGGQNQFQYKVTKDGQPFLDWTNFSSGNTTQIQNLSAGIYKIKVRDSNLCVAKENGAEKEITVTITQPSAAIAIPTTEIEISQPTGYGLSNGYISVRVIGGTPNTDGSYNFEWRKDSPTGPVITTGITTDLVNNPYTIKIDGLPAGNYYLTVKDKNYANASSQLGNCGIISQEFIMPQPEPLVVTIQVDQQISCNIANNYAYKPDLDNNGVPDEAEDGILKAIVTGGVGTYTYQWQKLNGGLFQNIAGATQSTLGNLTTGTYKVLVKDANNNMADTQYTLVFPAELAITLSANTIACYNQSSGQVSVTATGGTGGYNYNWNTGATTPTVTGLSAGNYFVLVNDTKNCKVSGSVQIQGPDQLLINDLSVQNPICFGANNGEIKIEVSGGKAPYNIVWSNGVTGLNNTSIPSGVYTVTVTDANGCSIFRNYTLTDPTQLIVDLGKDITLCLGDTQTYNVAISDPAATYQWKDQNGNIISTNPSITLSNAGTYTILITDSKGCTATDSVIIKNSSEVLNPQFMLTTHAYREATVVLVNTSPTQPQTVEWVIPDTPDIQVINKTKDFLELKFSKLGAYEIGLKGTQGACEKTFYKKVIVEENTSGVNLNPEKASNVREFTILPNPNNGVFKVLVGLEKAAIINIRIIDMISHEVYPATKLTPSTYFTVPFNTSLPGGSYLIILETGNEALVKKMLVQ
ncbi:SprB repeat-containing protein [Chryseobacterium rhizoplanae]|uniref:SprB repeat-containing protein n=1 Tax=Chryseobacterium rhizoplanae TaxID=1609531 RepID=UPI001CE293A3|nr:SprB repeat-containing protein [Chryseobacterium rhizoplanae]UCA58466.1 SprB repeat-containing protein [Chryseobacterium rhizoplanae]